MQLSFEYVKFLKRDSLDKWKKLAELKSQVQSCINCPNLVYSRKLYAYGKPTFGFGNPNSPIVFVGEAPGKYGCGVTGIPFTKDKSGRFLQEILKKYLGMSYNDIWITNCVKCCPEDNRTPTDEERSNCFTYLSQELEIIQPIVIVTLGLSATRALMPRTIQFSAVNSREHEFSSHRIPGFNPMHRGVIIPIWHPAFIIRTSESESKEIKGTKYSIDDRYKHSFKMIENCLMEYMSYFYKDGFGELREKEEVV